jgi:hypothetical protein
MLATCYVRITETRVKTEGDLEINSVDWYNCMGR